MNELKKTRFRQRFSNFEKAFNQLSNYTAIENPSDLERAGGIQYFEVTFELAWKMLKDYLESEGFNINSPRAAVKQAIQSNIIDDGHIWMDALEDRNLTVHTYDESIAIIIDQKIRTIYFTAVEKLYIYMREKNDLWSS